MPYDSEIKASIAAAAGAADTAVTETNSSDIDIGPMPATGLVFNVVLQLNSGDMDDRTATVKVYLMEKDGGTMREAGQLTFPDGAASTTDPKHASLVLARDLLSQVSGTVPDQIQYRLTIQDDGTTGDNAVNYKVDCYPAPGQGYTYL